MCCGGVPAGEVLAAVVDAGGDHARVQGAALGMEDPEPAVEALARQADRVPGRILRVTTGEAAGPPGAWAVSGGHRAATTSLASEPGTELITVSVRVRFALD